MAELRMFVMPGVEKARTRRFELMVDELGSEEAPQDSLLKAESLDGVFTRVESCFASILGWDPDELVGRNLLDFVHPDDVASTRADIEGLAVDAGSVSFENRFRAADGSYRQLDWVARRESSERQITTMAREFAGHGATRDPFLAALEASPVSQILVGRDGLIELANEAAERLFAYRRGELIGQSVEMLVPEELRQKHGDLRQDYSKQPGRRSMGTGRDLVALRRDGSQIPVEVGLNPVEFDGEMRVVAAIVDLTLRKEHERLILELSQNLELSNRRLSHLASTDELTALKNRRFFLEWLGVQIRLSHRQSSPLSLVMVDVDRFKDYNDSFGHPAGDDLLRVFSEVMTSVARRSDVVARFGGEEFVAGLPETGRVGGTAFGERIRQAVLSHDWSHRPITVSVGVATAGFDSRSALDSESTQSDLIASVDRALYASKEAGRNRVTHADDL